MDVKSLTCLLPALLSLNLFVSSSAAKTLPAAEAKTIHQLEPVIVSADRIRQPINTSASSATLISGEELAEKRPSRIDDLLRGSPGVSINSSGTTGETITIRLRGSASNQTLVLIDGLKVNSPWDGTYGEWGNTDLGDIDRIEILRGTQSELYGSEAMGGVVQLFTKGGGKSRGAALSLGAGSFGTLRESVEHSGGGERVNYLFSAFTQKISPGQFDHDAYWSKGLSGRFDWQIDQSLSLSAICRLREAEKELAVNPEGAVSATQATFFWDDKGRRRDRLSQQTLAIEGYPYDVWHYRITFGALQDHYRAEKGVFGQPAALSITDVSSGRLVVETQHDFTWPSLSAGSGAFSHTSSLGLEYEQDAADGLVEIAGIPSSRNSVDKSRSLWSLFFQDRIESHSSVLTAGLRWDKNSAYGKVVSPRLSESLLLDQKSRMRLKMSWAKGFRAPTFKELYYPKRGNPNLNPERNTSFEVGLVQSPTDKLTVGCTWFRMKFQDLITKTLTSAENIGQAASRGIEGEITYHPLSNLDLQLSYTYLDSEDKDHGHEIPEMPRHTWKIAAGYHQGGFFLSPVIQIISREYSLSYLDPPFSLLDLQGHPMKKYNPGYSRIDLVIQYDLPHYPRSANEWQWYARINNLLDKEYYEVQGFPAPGINFLTGISGRF